MLILIQKAPHPTHPNTLYDAIYASLVYLDRKPIPTTETFEQQKPQKKLPRNRRIAPPEFWDHAEITPGHTHHDIANTFPEIARSGLIQGS